jgi:fatty-acid peroxygenase
MSLIEKIRQGILRAPEGSPAYLMAFSPDFDGKPMDTHMAAVELLNLVRPTVAISWYIAFTGLALHEHPEYREMLRTGNTADVECFVHEVRRFYPFAPFLGAKVRTPFEWRGYRFRQGALVLLDVYGTNRDHRQWQRPNSGRSGSGSGTKALLILFLRGAATTYADTVARANGSLSKPSSKQ